MARKGVLLLETLAQRPCQRTSLYVPKLGYTDSGGVELQCGAHAGEERNAARGGMEDERGLAGQTVYGIYHIIILGKIKLVCGVRTVKQLDGIDLNGRIDSRDPLCRNGSFVLTNGSLGGKELALEMA